MSLKNEANVKILLDVAVLKELKGDVYVPGDRSETLAPLGEEIPPPPFDWASSIKFWYSM